MSKRALVVDDSKSSRLFLGKLLFEQQLQVDEAESAEAAIEYLGKNQPDVIFMDHLMPGMDGFQAVQAIKANPRTAQIPILMYTSQEGELYLGQAQALGAAGVVAKGNTEAGELGAVLQSLWSTPTLESSIVVETPDAAMHESAQLQAAVTVPEPKPATAATEAPAAVAANLLPDAWRSEITALREQFTLALNAQRTAVSADLRSLLREAHQSEVQPAMRPEEPRHSPVPWMLAVLAAATAAVFGTLYWQGDEQRAALRAELADSREAVALLTARLAPPPEPEPPVLDDAALADALHAAAFDTAVTGATEVTATTAAPAASNLLPATLATPVAAPALHTTSAPAPASTPQSPAGE